MIERLEAVDLINEDERPDMREDEAFWAEADDNNDNVFFDLPAVFFRPLVDVLSNS